MNGILQLTKEGCPTGTWTKRIIPFKTKGRYDGRKRSLFAQAVKNGIYGRLQEYQQTTQLATTDRHLSPQAYIHTLEKEPEPSAQRNATLTDATLEPMLPDVSSFY